MPAYWDLNIEFDINACSLRDFYGCLTDCGVIFDRGYWKSEGFNFEQALANHQQFADDPTFPDGSLYQDMFKFRSFSEVRGYWHFGETALFTLIIPEDDFIFWESDIDPRSEEFRKTDEMDAVKALAVHLWESLDLLLIQTAWECSDVSCHYSELVKEGYPPQAEPFALVDNKVKTGEMSRTSLANKGYLVEDDRNWLFI